MIAQVWNSSTWEAEAEGYGGNLGYLIKNVYLHSINCTAAFHPCWPSWSVSLDFPCVLVIFCYCNKHPRQSTYNKKRFTFNSWFWRFYLIISWSGCFCTLPHDVWLGGCMYIELGVHVCLVCDVSVQVWLLCEAVVHVFLVCDVTLPLGLVCNTTLPVYLVCDATVYV